MAITRPKIDEIRRFFNERRPLNLSGDEITVKYLPGSDIARHWNWRLVAKGKTYILRIENNLAIVARGTKLEDEFKLLQIFYPYGLSPEPLYFCAKPQPILMEEWIDAKPLSSVEKLTREHLRRLAEFIILFHQIPVAKVKNKFPFKEDFLDYESRRETCTGRLRHGLQLPYLKEWHSRAWKILDSSLIKFEGMIKKLPRRALDDEVISYRDITGSNIFLTKPHYKAVDWEWHSVGISDPSFSVVVLMRRFKLSEADQEFVINEYLKKRPTAYLRELIQVRHLERAIGEFTWPFGWAAKRSMLNFKDKKQQSDLKKGIKETYKNLQSALEVYS